MLGAMAGLNVKSILGKSKLFEELKGALTEQYVLQQLKADSKCDIFYWSSETATAEIDYLLQTEEQIVPVEVKAEENLQAKSLRSFVQKYHSDIAVRLSMSNYRKEEWLINIPLYAITADYVR